MADILSLVKESLIEEVISAERYLKGAEVDEAKMTDELGKLNLFSLTETSAYAREAVQLRQLNDAAYETRRMIEASRRQEEDKGKKYLS